MRSKKAAPVGKKSIWTARDVRIQIKYGRHSLLVIGTFRCDKTGAIHFRPKESPAAGKALFLYHAYTKHSRVVPTVRISGIDREGRKYGAAHCDITRANLRSTSRGTRLPFELDVHGLLVTLPESQRGIARVLYNVPGLRGFHPLRVEDSDFVVHAHGEHRPLSFEHLTGTIALDTKRAVGSNDRKLLKSIDARARRLLDLLSLAEGRWLRWSVTSVYVDEKLCSLRFSGPSITSPPRLGVFHFLNLDPVVRLAVEHYDEHLRLRTGIDVAIEWMVSNPRYTEAEVVAMFIALEHLIYVHRLKRDAGTLPKQAFDSDIRLPIRTYLSQLLQGMRSRGIQVTGEQEKRLLDGISELNRPTFRQGLLALIKEYSVPTGGIYRHISSILQLRNDIVHRGIRVSPQLEKPLSFYAAVCRELLVRIVLAILRYRGSYESYLNGPKTRKFEGRKRR